MILNKNIRHRFSLVHLVRKKRMANPTTTTSKFDDDDVNDDELLAAFNDEDNLIPKKSDPVIPIGNSNQRISLK